MFHESTPKPKPIRCVTAADPRSETPSTRRRPDIWTMCRCICLKQNPRTPCSHHEGTRKGSKTDRHDPKGSKVYVNEEKPKTTIDQRRHNYCWHIGRKTHLDLGQHTAPGRPFRRLDVTLPVRYSGLEHLLYHLLQRRKC